jgi:hypothetical protein
MRQLRSCDFCDADADLGVYEVVPDHLDGAAERRLVLCPDCRDRLDWVLEPFLDHLEGGPADADAGADEDVTLLGVSQSSPRSTSRRTTSTDADERDGSEGESSEPDASAASDDDEATDGGDDDASASAAPAGASTAERAAADTPPKYRQVMRFLGNRDLPIDRMEAESLASGAYDLDAGEASDIVDAALERGLLVEEDGQLRPA